MKKLTCLILGVILISVYACKREVPICCGPTPTPSNGPTLFAQRNGIAWRPLEVKGTLRNDTITISSLGIASKTDTTFLLDSLSLKIKYTAPGSYKLASDQVSYYTVVTKQFPYNHTDPLKSYTMDSSFDNEVDITGFDQSTGKVSGTFNLKFTDPANTAGISLLNGKVGGLLSK